MKKIVAIIKEPLFLFVFLGIIIYACFTVTTGFIERKNKTIRVTAMQVELQKELFTKTWNRPPGDNELQGQIDNLVMDEIFYKEAVELGLDKSDVAVKRRLRQMMELMLEDFSTITPNENQLRTYLNENPEKFLKDPKLSFEHLYFTYEEKEKAEQLLPKLKANHALAEQYFGGLNMIADKFSNETAREVSRSFGNEFTQTLMDTQTKEWFGPVVSPFGYHLVKISQKIPGELPELNEIWAEVEQEWSVQNKQELKKEHYRKLKEQYKIVIETNEKL